VKTFLPKVAGHVVLSPADHQAMLEGFEGAVNDSDGTAFPSFNSSTALNAGAFPFASMTLAGKTGTASASEQVPTSWFVGWGPVNNPTYLIAVVIEKGGYGASAAAPVARAGFQYLVTHPAAPVVLAAPTTGSGSVPSTTTTTATTTSTSTPAS